MFLRLEGMESYSFNFGNTDRFYKLNYSNSIFLLLVNGRRTRSTKRARLEVPEESSGGSTSASLSSSSRATTKRKSRDVASGEGTSHG